MNRTLNDSASNPSIERTATGSRRLPLMRALRSICKTVFKLRGLATIADIPTEEFNALVASLQKEGWRRTYEYAGFDAWIDYGCIKLRKQGVTLKCEWDNWTEGSVEGPKPQVEELAVRMGRPALDQWRWSLRA